MKNKKIFILLSFLSLTLLAGCNSQTATSSTTLPDLNKYDQIVDDEKAKSWILGTYNKFMTLNGFEVDTKVKEYSFKDVEIPIPNDENSSPADFIPAVETKTKLQLNTKMDQKMTILGISSTDPNKIKASYHATNIYCSIVKPGLNPNNKDTVKADNGRASAYIKDNIEYNDISDKNVRDFFPYMLFAFGNFETIDLAKAEAQKIPEKFYDPTPVFKSENLPLNQKLTTINGVKFDVALMKIMNENKKASSRFLNFYTNGENLKVVLQFTRDHLIDAIVRIADSQNITITKEDATAYANDFVTFNAFEMDFVFSKEYLLDYQNVNIDLSFSAPINDENGEMDALRTISFDCVTHSWFDFESPVVTYPEDLSSYQEYDLSLPEIEIPNIGDGGLPIEPF